MSDAFFNSRTLPGTPEPNGVARLPRISGELSIGTAQELRNALLDYAATGPDIVVDLSEVGGCDTAALQLLYSLRNTAVQQGKRLRIAPVSPAVNEIAIALGLRLDELTGGMNACLSEPRSADRGV